jgi:glycosyltransferase involved in cell wall biosynthesis
MTRISVLINTCNEAHLLEDSVRSVRALADEIIVCDMQSSDGTAELAGELGCTLIRHPRMPAPEPEARIAAINAATGQWLLIFDPDMRITPETARRLREIAENDEADMVDFYCINYYFGRCCPHGHASQPVFRKFFKKTAFQARSLNIQTFWHDSLNGRSLQLGREHGILHLGYATVADCVETLTRYASREADQARELGKKPSIRRMLWRPVKRFMGNYIWRRGFLDGMPGLIVMLAVSWYLFLTEALLWQNSASSSAEKAIARARRAA